MTAGVPNDRPRHPFGLVARMLVETGVCLVLAGAFGVLVAGWLDPGSTAGDVLVDAYAIALPADWTPDRDASLVQAFAERFPGTRPGLDGSRTLAWFASRTEGVAAVFAWLREQGVPTETFQIGPGWLRLLERLAEQPNDLLSSAPLLLGLLLPTALVFLAVGWRWRRRLGLAAEEVGPRGPRALGLGILAGAAMLVAALVLERGLAALGWVVSEQALFTDLVEQGGGALIAFLALALCFAPLGEEVLFRGALFATLAQRGHVGLAYLVSTAAFAGAHMNPSALPLYVLYGLSLGWVYRRARSLTVVVTAHVVVNAGALSLSLAGGA
ncbi:MAG: lysostaphin resistance A-like protein [Planctomycetota bacterium]|jgi:membrane protease YdiL (CAAX protease family)